MVSKFFFVSAWFLILATTALDIGFTLSQSHILFEEWEANPVAKWVINSIGIEIALAMRACTILAGMILICFLPTQRKRNFSTFCVLIPHLYIFATFAFIYLTLSAGPDGETIWNVIWYNLTEMRLHIFQ